MAHVWEHASSEGRGLARDAGGEVAVGLKPVNSFEKNPALNVPWRGWQRE